MFAGASPGITGLGRYASWQGCIDHCPNRPAFGAAGLRTAPHQQRGPRSLALRNERPWRRPGHDLLVGNAETTTFFGEQDADIFDVNGGVNWIMDFEPGVDRIAATLGAGQAIESIASQHDMHLLVDFGAGGDQVWLANTALADLAGVDVLV